MDGTVTKLDDRQKRIGSFQKNRSYTVFLLTTQVGGVGLTLTGADRVVICKYSWQCMFLVMNFLILSYLPLGEKGSVMSTKLCGGVLCIRGYETVNAR